MADVGCCKYLMFVFNLLIFVSIEFGVVQLIVGISNLRRVLLCACLSQAFLDTRIKIASQVLLKKKKILVP